jgi:hypothetical protein
MTEPNSQRIFVERKTDDPFARVPKSILDAAQLSWKAKGILAYLLGKPSGWKLRVSDIAKRGKDGVAAIKAALKELRAAGYIELYQVRGFDNGKIAEWIWNVSDAPIYSIEPQVDFQQVENQQVENRPLSKKEDSKKDSREILMTISDEIWEAYPRKVNKPAGMKAITRAIKATYPDQQRILTATRLFAEKWKGVPATSMEFVPHPATWFNGERYNDDPGTWQKPDPKGAPPPADPGAGWDEAEYMAGVRARKEAANE